MATKLAEATLEIPTVSWSEFKRGFVWKQGEHMTTIGPNGRGKSIVVQRLLYPRDYVVVLATKSKDDTMNDYRKFGFEIVRKWPPPPDMRKVILWPIGGPGGQGKNAPKDPASDKAIKHKIIKACLDDVYRRGGWCVVFDEFRYITDSLKLRLNAEEMLMQGRSMDITCVVNIQRPAWVPLAAYSELKHLFVWENPDEANNKRLGEISAIKKIQEIAQGLDYHEFVYVDTIRRRQMISQVDLNAA